MKKNAIILLLVMLLEILLFMPARSDWYDVDYNGGNIPEPGDPEIVDDGSSDNSSNSSDDDWDREEAARQRAEQREEARQEAERRAAERREAARQAALEREAARQEAQRQEALRRAEAQRTAERREAERRAEIERQRLEAESKRLGFGPHIRTISVPVPQSSDITYYNDREIKSNRSPVISLSSRTYVVIGTIGKCIKDIPAKVGEFILTYAGRRVGISDAEDYLSIIKLNKGLADDATSQMQSALNIIQRGYPEPETNEFLNSSQNRGLRVFVDSMSDVPSHAIILSPTDEEELEREGRSYFKWLN